MIEAVIFDWDGVVAHSRALQVESEQRTATAMAQEMNKVLDIDSFNWSRFEGWARAKIAAELFGLDSQDPLCDAYRLKVVENTVSVISRHNLWPVEGALSFIGLLRMHSCMRAVATSSNRKILDPSLELFGLENEFHTTVAHQECLDDKPLPGQYREVMRRLNTSPERTLVVEDSAGGINSARCAGALVLGIATTKPVNYLRSSTGAHMVAENFEHATQLVRHLVK